MLRSVNETDAALKEAELQTASGTSDSAISVSDDSEDGDDDGSDSGDDGDDDTGDDDSDGPPNIVSSATNTNETAADSNFGQALKSDTLANFTMPSPDQPIINPNATDNEDQASTSDQLANSTASADNEIPAPLPSNHKLYASGGYFYGGAPHRDVLIMEIITCVVMCLTLSMTGIGQ